MSISPKDFLNSAKKSINESSEVSWRNAVSRAYYSAFHTCLLYAEDKLNFACPKHNAHSSLISLFESEPENKYKSIGYMLRQCRKMRNLCDYELDLEISKGEAISSLKQSERIIEHIEAE